MRRWHNGRRLMSWRLVTCQDLAPDDTQLTNIRDSVFQSLFIPEVPLIYQRCDVPENAALLPENPQLLAARTATGKRRQGTSSRIAIGTIATRGCPESKATCAAAYSRCACQWMLIVDPDAHIAKTCAPLGASSLSRVFGCADSVVSLHAGQ